MELPAPDAADGLGPGVALIITIPGEGRFGCSANFVWESGTRRFLGAAGHCFLPADRAGTHGPGADYDASGVTVDACVSDCAGNFRTNQLLGTWVRLGRVVYARQTQDGEDVGNDFGLVEIPASLIPGIRTSMPVWGGPSGVGTLGLGSLACHYGHGLVFGEVFATKARTGVGGGEEEGAWMGEFAAGPGDSGSGLVLCTPVLLGFSGGGAVGILTHLGIAADPETGEHGVVLGTTVARAIAMAAQAGLQVRVVPAP